MNKETLRMQMLAGLITESEYKARLNENNTITDRVIEDFIDSYKSLPKEERPSFYANDKTDPDGYSDLQDIAYETLVARGETDIDSKELVDAAQEYAFNNNII
jgi:hypothetical protein